MFKVNSFLVNTCTIIWKFYPVQLDPQLHTKFYPNYEWINKIKFVNWMLKILVLTTINNWGLITISLCILGICWPTGMYYMVSWSSISKTIKHGYYWLQFLGHPSWKSDYTHKGMCIPLVLLLSVLCPTKSHLFISNRMIDPDYKRFKQTIYLFKYVGL